MKKSYVILCFAIMVLLPLVSAAQSSQLWDGTKSTAPVTLRGMVGLNLSHFTHVERWNEIKAGVNVGVMAEKPILNSLSAINISKMGGTVGNGNLMLNLSYPFYSF